MDSPPVAMPPDLDLPSTPTEDEMPALAEAGHYREAALEGQQGAALGLVLRAMESGLSLTEASVGIVQPAMYEIGRLWQEKRITVAQEHMATAITQNVLAGAYLHAHFAAPLGRRAIFAAVPGNHHCLGLRMVSDAFETQGWQCRYLGADVPIADLIAQVESWPPDLLALSLSMPEHLAAARILLGCLRGELGSRCPPIWVGGLATRPGDKIWQFLKADGWATDALDAQAKARQWQ